MFELYPTSWPASMDATDSRTQFHETALREAQVATDARGVAAAAPSREPFITRLRLAFAGGSSVATEPCSCPA